MSSLLTPYDLECILLGEVLTFGEEAFKAIYPALSHDKFFHSTNGMRGSRPHHAQIYQAITQAHAAKKPFNTPNLLEYLPSDEDYVAHLKTLKDRLNQQYGVSEYDWRGIRGRATAVDRNGYIYRTVRQMKKFTDLLDDEGKFNKFAEQIKDVDAWANSMIGSLKSAVRPQDQGYTHVSAISPAVRERVKDIRDGKSMLLNCGMPSFTNRALFPYGKFVVMHGMSNSGKSLLMHQINLGTAFTLKLGGIKGCVAINSLEESREDLMIKWAGVLAGIDRIKMLKGKDALSNEEWDRFEEWLAVVEDLPIYIDGTNAITSSVMEFRLEGLHGGLKGPVWQLSADYDELFSTKDLEGIDNKEQGLSALSDNFFRISRQLLVLTMLISQSTYGSGNNKAKIAGALGTRYSSAALHRADIVMEILNYIEMKKMGITYDIPGNLDENNVWVLIEKYRNGPKGDPIPLRWIPETTRLMDPELETGLAVPILFEHFRENAKLQKLFNTSVISPKDSPLAEQDSLF